MFQHKTLLHWFCKTENDNLTTICFTFLGIVLQHKKREREIER